MSADSAVEQQHGTGAGTDATAQSAVPSPAPVSDSAPATDNDKEVASGVGSGVAGVAGVDASNTTDASVNLATGAPGDEPQQHQHQPEESVINPASAIDGGRELSKTVLYVGGIHKSVTEDVLRELFSSLGSPIQSIKLLYDKNRPGFHYSFIEYATNAAADTAAKALNGTILANYPLKISWAYQTQQLKAGDAYNLFVGDLSPEVDDETLSSTFKAFPSFVQANVMWDMKTGRSRGYGFVSFRDAQDAERCLQTMNGEVICGRAIRLNWAAYKLPNQTPAPGLNISNAGHHHNTGGNQMLSNRNLSINGGVNQALLNGGAIPGNQNKMPIMGPQSYDIVLRQAPNWQCTVYLGNLAHFTTQNDLIPLLQNFGYIVDFKFHPEKGCAFVRYDSHERAALAIVQLTGFTINGRPLKCGWGKQQSNGPPPMNYMYRR